MVGQVYGLHTNHKSLLSVFISYQHHLAITVNTVKGNCNGHNFSTTTRKHFIIMLHCHPNTSLMPDKYTETNVWFDRFGYNIVKQDRFNMERTILHPSVTKLRSSLLRT